MPPFHYTQVCRSNISAKSNVNSVTFFACEKSAAVAVTYGWWSLLSKTIFLIAPQDLPSKRGLILAYVNVNDCTWMMLGLINQGEGNVGFIFRRLSRSGPDGRPQAARSSRLASFRSRFLTTPCLRGRLLLETAGRMREERRMEGVKEWLALSHFACAFTQLILAQQ